MKLSKLFLVGAIALGLVACNNDDVPGIQGNPDSTVSIKVIQTSNGSQIRATGDLSGSGIAEAGLVAESEIKQLEVFIFAGESPDGYGVATPATGQTTVTEVKGIDTHSGAKTIFVVANANIGEVANKAALLAKTKDLPVNIDNGMPMTSVETAVTLVAGLNQYGFADADQTTGANQISANTPLAITRVNARVAIVGAALNLTDQSLFDELRDVQVAMFNVPKASKLFGSPLAMNANFLYGVAWVSTETSYTADELSASFTDDATFPIVAAAAPYYYVTENNSQIAAEQMMIVLRGKPYLNNAAVVYEGLYTDADGYTYYPVWVNATKDGYTFTGDNTGDSVIRRNTQYNITLSITKIGNPTIDPPVEAILDVHVTVAPWLVVTQGVVW